MHQICEVLEQRLAWGGVAPNPMRVGVFDHQEVGKVISPLLNEAALWLTVIF